MSYIVKTPQFEGPIPVLYEMIEARKLSISEFGLSGITEDFLAYTRKLQEDGIHKQEIAGFIHVCATLLLLKSKSLLPEIEVTQEESRDIEILENQIKAYAVLKQVSKTLRTDYFIGPKTAAKVVTPKLKIKSSLDSVFVPDQKMDPDSMMQYIESRLAVLEPEKLVRNEVKVGKKIKIEDALNHVRSIVKKIKNFSFRTMSKGGFQGTDDRLREENKRTVVILFLAILELVKMGEVDVVQEENFSDMTIVELVVPVVE